MREKHVRQRVTWTFSRIPLLLVGLSHHNHVSVARVPFIYDGRGAPAFMCKAWGCGYVCMLCRAACLVSPPVFLTLTRPCTALLAPALRVLYTMQSSSSSVLATPGYVTELRHSGICCLTGSQLAIHIYFIACFKDTLPAEKCSLSYFSLQMFNFSCSRDVRGAEYK